ncbi:MAG: ABC transporter ATP-binding protein, partial [Candidatus Hydrogenedentes bacterium]|nr:ABC transporter ATP-binding protein [Candidatus Hydrogenedentota bacterium]
MNEKRFEEEDFTGRRNWDVWKNLFFRAQAHWRLLIVLGTVAIILAGLDVMFPLVTKWIIDDVTSGDAAQWEGHVILYFALVGGHAICVAVFICLAGKISTHFSYDIRQAGFKRLQELSFSFYDRRSVGWLVTRLTSDCDRLSRILAWGTLDL